jgi:Major Facilitator Superfamily
MLLAMTQFVIVIDASIVNVALPSIGAHLHFSRDDLTWVVNAYTLTFGGFLLLGGRMADLLGRRRMFMLGLVVFSLASLAGGMAQSETWLIAARAVQGLGAAIVSPAALSIITTTFADGAERNRALGIWGAVAHRCLPPSASALPSRCRPGQPGVASGRLSSRPLGYQGNPAEDGAGVGVHCCCVPDTWAISAVRAPAGADGPRPSVPGYHASSRSGARPCSRGAGADRATGLRRPAAAVQCGVSSRREHPRVAGAHAGGRARAGLAPADGG